MASDVSVTSGRGFRYIEELLHESTKQQISVQVRYIPDPKKQKIHHVDFVLIKKTKTPSQSWDDSEVTKINFTSEDPKSLQKLLAFIKAQPQLAKYKNAKVSVLEDIEEKEFVNKVLKAFNSPEKREMLSQAEIEDIDNLYASVKQVKNKKSLIKLKQLMHSNEKENKLQTWIKNNTWVFGVEYLEFLDIRKIGIHSDSDFIVESLDGYADLIELKKSSFPLFRYDESHDSYYPSSNLSQVLGQAIKYIKTMEDSRHLLKDEDGLNVLKPRIKIVIGRSNHMDRKEREALRLLNDTLHNIEVMTYDEIVVRAERLIKHYEESNEA